MYSKYIKTENTACRDCYKCVRECPVKAIEIKDEHATVLDEPCILCGHCVLVCPNGAKKVRDDKDAFTEMIANEEKIIISLAPSFINEFKDANTKQIIKAFEKMGAFGVSETALGADIVTNDSREILDGEDGPIINYTSACPAAVYYIEKYAPNSTDKILATLSPLGAHGKLLKERFGDEFKVVFVGPCVAKKKEVDEKDDSVDLALTFSEVKEIFTVLDIDPEKIHNYEDAEFITQDAGKGNLYPIENGFFKSLFTKYNTVYNTLSYSGIGRIFGGLKDSECIKSNKKIVVELLACEGGCINGPCTTQDLSFTEKVVNVMNRDNEIENKTEKYSVCESYEAQNIKKSDHADIDIVNKLREIGKKNQEDELNCSGCGYDSCRDFAAALLDGKAEATMCVSYMRKLAQNKAASLVKTMPVGLVIVDKDGKIVECNEKFAKIVGEEAHAMYEVMPGLEGATLSKFIDFKDLFDRVLHAGTERLDRDITFKGKKLQSTIFTIDKGELVGRFFQDVTEPSVAREKVIDDTATVIRKNLETVQNIAYLLGENAAETERVLTSIKTAFGPKED